MELYNIMLHKLLDFKDFCSKRLQVFIVVFLFLFYIYKHCISSLSSATGEDIPPLQLKEGVFRCIMQLYDCLLTEVHERCKKGLSLAKRLNSSLAFFCYDLLSIIEPRQVFELVYLLYLKVPSKFTV